MALSRIDMLTAPPATAMASTVKVMAGSGAP